MSLSVLTSRHLQSAIAPFRIIFIDNKLIQSTMHIIIFTRLHLYGKNWKMSIVINDKIHFSDFLVIIVEKRSSVCLQFLYNSGFIYRTIIDTLQRYWFFLIYMQEKTRFSYKFRISCACFPDFYRSVKVLWKYHESTVRVLLLQTPDIEILFIVLAVCDYSTKVINL